MAKTCCFKDTTGGSIVTSAFREPRRGGSFFSQDPVDPAAESERVLLAADTVVAYFENRGAGKTLDTKII